MRAGSLKGVPAFSRGLFTFSTRVSGRLQGIGNVNLTIDKVKVKSPSPVQLFATPWTVAYQAPPSMEFSRQEYWSGLLFPSPGDLPNPGIKPRFPALQADTLPSEPPGKPIDKTRANRRVPGDHWDSAECTDFGFQECTLWHPLR